LIITTDGGFSISFRDVSSSFKALSAPLLEHRKGKNATIIMILDAISIITINATAATENTDPAGSEPEEDLEKN